MSRQPEDELGVVVPVEAELGRTARGLVVLRAVTVHADGLILWVAARRTDAPPGLDAHGPMRHGPADPELDPWVEVTTDDGRGRLALGHHGPVEVSGGLVLGPASGPLGGGVWLAPLPREGVIRIRAVWPDADVDGSVELPAAPLAERAAGVVQLPPEPDEPPSWAVLDEQSPGTSWASMFVGADEGAAPSRPPPLLGRTLDWHDVLAADGEAAISAGPVVAFPSGFTVTVTAHVRAPLATGWTGYGPGAVDAVSVAFVDDDGQELAATPQHGAAGDREQTATHWVTPLPERGNVILECTWAERGLGPASTMIDGDVLRAAAARAEELGP